MTSALGSSEPPAAPSTGRRTAWWLAIVALALTAALGLLNGVRDLSEVESAEQLAVTVGVIVYAVLAVVALIAVRKRHRRLARWSIGTWGVAVTGVATLAPSAYGDQDLSSVGVLAGGVAAALVGYGVWRAITREMDRRAGVISREG